MTSANREERPLFPPLTQKTFSFYSPPDSCYYTDFFHFYFLFSCYCRFCNKHPLGMFGNAAFSEKTFLDAVEGMNERLLRICEEEKKDFQVVRSAIGLIEEDFVSHVEGASPLWEKFLKGDGMKRLEERLKRRQKKLGRTAKDLRNVPMTHDCWSERDRRDSERKFGKYTGNRPSFLQFFSEHREKMLCFLEYLGEDGNTMTETENSEIAQHFLRNFFSYWKICLRYRKDPLNVMTSKEREVFNKSLYLSIPFFHLATNNTDLWRDLENLRIIRSAIQFLEDDVISFEPSFISSWETFKILGKIDELDEFLTKKTKEEPEYYLMWDDLYLIPGTHFWWPEGDRKRSEKRRKGEL